MSELEPRMDHAAAHERIEDLVLEPALLDGLATSTRPEDAALREHLEGCPACRADLDGWRSLQRRIAGALPDPATAAAAVEPIELPPSLRATVLAAARSGERPLQPIEIERRSRSRMSTWLGLAASLVLLAGAAVITLDQASRQAAARAEANALATVLNAVDGVLAAEHKVVELRRPDGSNAGSISWSRHDWVVLTTALDEPPAGQRYLCWLEDGGRSVSVGAMEFAGDTAFWVATVDDWATWEIGPDTRFIVTLEAADADTRTGDVILEADLGS